MKSKLRRVKAMYDCVADHHDELTFNEGDVLVVLGEEDADWWVSIRKKKEQLIWNQFKRECERQETSTAMLEINFLGLWSALKFSGH